MSEPEDKLVDDQNGVDTGTGTAPVPPTAVSTQTETDAQPAEPVAPSPLTVTAPAAPEPPKDLDKESPAAVKEDGLAKEASFEPDAEPETYQEAISKPDAKDVLGMLPPQENALRNISNDMLLGQDIDNGHITPKTYHDLFAEKSTLGKIGSIFGLLIAGAGAGLTHSTNAVSDMWDKQIANDLEAQKTSSHNKQTWFKTAMENENAISNREEQSAVVALKRAGVYTANLENDFKKYQNASAGLRESDATITAENGMRLAALSKTQTAINQMPPGPGRDRAQAEFDTKTKPQEMQKIINSRKRQALQHALFNKTNPNPLKTALEQMPEPGKSPINQGKFDAMVQHGAVVGKDLPGVIGPGEKDAAIGEKNSLERNRTAHGEYVKAFTDLSQMGNAGQVPMARVAGSLASSVGAGLGTMVGGFFGGPAGSAVGGGMGSATGEAAGHAASDLQSAFERERTSRIANLKKTYPEYDWDAILPAWNDTKESMPKVWETGNNTFRNMPIEKATNTLTRKGIRPNPGKDFPMTAMPGARGKEKR